MIVILEGANGVGKTTLAAGLSSRLHLTPYKPFREFGDGHWDGSGKLERELKCLEVPFNTHAEDLFMADFLAKFRPEVLLDRSMPSGIAYGRPPPGALAVWQTILGPCDVRYIWLRSSFEVANRRSPGRAANRARHHAVERSFLHTFHSITFKKLFLDTTHLSQQEVLEQSVGFLLNS